MQPRATATAAKTTRGCAERIIGLSCTTGPRKPGASLVERCRPTSFGLAHGSRARARAEVRAFTALHEKGHETQEHEAVERANETEQPELPSRTGFGVVITGSTKGVGLALAKEFLRMGDRVVVCSRRQSSVDETVQVLAERYGKDRVFGVSCDVSDAADVKVLGEFASSRLGLVDIWINNAGTNAYQFKSLIETSSTDLREIVETNTLGLMLCMKEAINLMKSQEDASDPAKEYVGHIFNMDGAGTSGSATPRFAAYGATKRAITQLNKSVQAELGMLKIGNVKLHMLSPGMVTTDLLMAGGDTKIAKYMINALAEEPKDVATFLVPRVRQVVTDPRAGGPEAGQDEGLEEMSALDSVMAAINGGSTYIKYLTLPKAFSQILTKAVFGTRKNRFIQEE